MYNAAFGLRFFFLLVFRCFFKTKKNHSKLHKHPLLFLSPSSFSACISKYSAGSVFYYPSFHYIHNPAQLEKFQRDLGRYLTRKIGFEAVMRIRCTKGILLVCVVKMSSKNPVVWPHCPWLPPQVYPSIRSTVTSLCAPPTCCPWPTWTQTLPSPSRCPSKTLWWTRLWPASRLLYSTHQVKVLKYCTRTQELSWCLCFKINT